jgi:hypothetical protein
MFRRTAIERIAVVAALVSIAVAQKRIDLGNLPRCDAKQNQLWQTLQTEVAGVYERP